MVLHQHTPHLCLPTQSKNEYIRTMSAIAARPLKRLASSDIDDPPSRHPAPPQFEGTTAPGTASATVDVRHSLALSSPSLLPLVSTPTSLDATIASLTVSMASDVGDSPKLPSSPPSQLESPTTRTLVLPDLIINQSPRSPASPNQRTSSVIIIPDSSSPIAPPPSQPVPLLSAPDIPLNANVSSSAPASPSPVHNCSATPDPDTQDSDNDTEEIDSDSDACAYTQLECRMTHSPRLDLIVPCARYVKDVVILLTSTKLSPVRWTWIGPTTTYILHGFNFVMAYNKSLPASYSKVLVTTINDTIPIPLRKRINRAIPMPDKPHYGLCGLSQPLSTLAHMAAMFLNQRDGGGLITTFSWQEPVPSRRARAQDLRLSDGVTVENEVEDSRKTDISKLAPLHPLKISSSNLSRNLLGWTPDMKCDVQAVGVVPNVAPQRRSSRTVTRKGCLHATYLQPTTIAAPSSTV
ncbi:hypothetical protein BD410DRAFT_806625 [Rickenella mellea]|uniref:Uncharacterized protein n=1 Tax=Rickenella mellea TaxID=50990 RepID=A0A4Y7PT91_9AGAM|nr:hypothetical protein BD410DRAFT_806625 [Rickenella mellea]